MKQILTHRFAFYSCYVIFVGRIPYNFVATPQDLNVFMMQNLIQKQVKSNAREEMS